MVIPEAWIKSADADHSVKRYLLVEMGRLVGAERARMCDHFTGRYWPIIKDQDQSHLILNGPWLFQLVALESDVEVVNDCCPTAFHALIESELEGITLSSQFTPAMKVISPEGVYWGLRFYHPEVIKILASEVDFPWYKQLFNGVVAWYYPASGGTQITESLLIEAIERAARDKAWQLTTNGELWRRLVGDKEVNRLVGELSEEAPNLISKFRSPELRPAITEAIQKADAAGLYTESDRRTFVFLYLSEGESLLEQSDVKKMLNIAAAGEATLLEQFSLQNLGV